MADRRTGRAAGRSSSRWNRRRATQGVVALVVAVVPFMVTVPPAFAGVGLGVTPTFPSTVTVGQSALSASLDITTTALMPENTSNVDISAIYLVPACGGSSPGSSTGDCPAADADPGVFTVSSTATGAAGTACPGTAFTVAVIDPATGQVSFTPNTPVVLGPSDGRGASPICQVDFTVSVLKAPTHPAGTTGSGALLTDQLGFVEGAAVSDGVSGTSNGSSPVEVVLAAPGFSSTASAGGPLGTSISDRATLSPASPPGPGETVTVAPANPTVVTFASASGTDFSDMATLSGGATPTGTITFSLYGPGNPTCTGTAIFTSTVSASGDGNYPSAAFSPSAVGVYNYVAVYSGDANNNAVVSACGSPNESVEVSPPPAQESIVTTASASVAVGGQISDTATLSSLADPTGTITFSAYGPGNPTCTGTAVFTSTVPVNGAGSYPSGAFTATATGTYNFVAAYSGDPNNPSVMSPCGAANESVNVTRVTPAIVTHASATIAVGGTISDTADLAGGVNPTGTITFDAYNNPSCTGTPVFTSLTSVAGDGAFSSAVFTTAAVGTYQFVASYSGDTNNNPVVTACGAAGESVVVTPASPIIATTASPSVPVGGDISDTAVLSGAVNPTGVITFSAYGPNDATCSTTHPFTSTLSVSGNGTYASDPFTVTTPGTYRFTAAYSGDANNAAATSGCAAADESVVVSPPLGGLYTAVTPARDLDTRTGTGGARGPIPGNTTFAVTVTGVNGVPAGGVGAVVLNVTVTDATCAAWLTVYPTGQAVPGSSNLNYVDGETIANLVAVGVSSAGQVSFNVPAACSGSVQVVADVEGWYAPSTPAVPGGYTALVPARDLDTRNGTGGVRGPIRGNTTFNLTVTGVNGVPATGVGAVVLNVTVTAPTCAAWLTAFPTLQPVPGSSNLNYVAGETIANLVAVGVSSGGQVSFNVPAACSGSVQVVADVEGWYAAQTAPPSAGSYTPLTPGRDLDTRNGTGGVRGPIAGTTTFSVTVTGVNGVPATGVGAVALNVTVTGPTCAAWLTVYPTGQAVPGSSNLNYAAGETIANLVIVGVSSAGQVSFNVPTACTGTVQVIADIQGWYGPTP